MDNIDYLRCRNIELETELRLVREQLTQAQSGTQYLLTCLSNQHSQAQTHRSNVARTEAHQPFERGNARVTDGGQYSQSPSNTFTSQTKLSSPSLDNDSHYRTLLPRQADRSSLARKVYNKCQDLLTLDNDDPSTATAVVSPTSVRSSPAYRYETSLIDSSPDTPPTPFTPPRNPQNVPGPASEPPLIGLGISNGDADEEEIEQWRACRSPSPPEPVLIFSRPFADFEHNRLMNAALFTEEMSAEEQMAHWEFLAREKGRHSAEEWKLYYGEVIRPAYLAKVSVSGTGHANKLEEYAEDYPPVGGNEKGAPEEVMAESGLRASTSAPQAGASGIMQSSPTCDRILSGLNARATSSAPANISSDDLPNLRDGSIAKRDAKIENEQIAETLQQANFSPLSMPDTRASVAENTPSEALKVLAPADASNSSREIKDINSSTRLRSSSPFPRDNTPARRPPRRPFPSPISVSDIFFEHNAIEPSLFRTVLISNIPPTTTLTEILREVKGGKIISATFLQTAGMKTRPPMETNAALIQFLDAHQARAYVDFCKNTCPILFTSAVGEQRTKAIVELIQTPSRPLNPKLRADIQNGLTRVLFIIDEKARWSTEEIIAELVRCGVHSPLNAGQDKDGILFFEFADARDAGAAWQVVDQRHWFFGGASKGFLPDPCARALEGALEDSGVDDGPKVAETTYGTGRDVGGDRRESDGS